MYLTGESFAGHYIPAIANYLYVKTNIQIAGLAIGNGWVDPVYQFPSYPGFAAANGIIQLGHAEVLSVIYRLCQYSLILEVPLFSGTFCMFAGFSIATPVFPEFNMYDIREPCVEPGLCYPNNHIGEILNSELYRQKFNI